MAGAVAGAVDGAVAGVVAAYMHAHTCTQTHIYAYMHTYIHACIHARIQAYLYTYMHAHANTHTCIKLSPGQRTRSVIHPLSSGPFFRIQAHPLRLIQNKYIKHRKAIAHRNKFSVC